MRLEELEPRVVQAEYLLWPVASGFDIVVLAKAAASFWSYLALGMLCVDILSRAGRRAGGAG